MTRVLTAATLAVLCASFAVAQPLGLPLAVAATNFALISDKEPELPNTPAGKVAKAYLAAFNDSSEGAQQKFEEKYRVAARLAETSASERANRMKAMREKNGEFKITQIRESEANTITLRLMGSKGTEAEMKFVLAAGDFTKLDFIMVSADDTPAQPLDTDERAAAVEDAAKAMETGYVFPEVGAKMAAAIREKHKSGAYDALSDVGLARAISDEFIAVSNDKHIGMRVQPQAHATAQPSHMPSESDMSRENYYFRKVERLDGNIGYIKFDLFLDDQGAKDTALLALKFVANCNAIIFDLRQNGGGSPDMIRFITSSLFDKPTLLNQMMDRDSKIVEEYTTLADFAGPRFGADIPIFVLTSNRTFSGAEEFSYNLKNLKRATIVGETTGGGAHPVRGEKVGDRFMLRVPFMRAHNPITKTNWEGTGVEPDVKVPADKALEKALELARSKAVTTAKP